MNADDRVIAVLTIHDAAHMTLDERRELAAWLHAHARELLAMGDTYTKYFTARYSWRHPHANQTDD